MQNTFANAHEQENVRRSSYYWNEQSLRNMLYLLLAFPLGIFYFVLLVTGISTGLSTLIIWVGIPILIGTFWAWWQCATFERYLSMRLLRIYIAPMQLQTPLPAARIPLWQRVQAQLSNSMTWKTLAYLLLKFPLGILSFCLTLILPILTLGVIIVTLVLSFLSAPFYALLLALQDKSDAKSRLQRYLLFGLQGFGLGALTFFVLNSMADFSGACARLLLGMSDTGMRLEEARARAALERQKAEEAEQRRRTLVVNVSHELRTPVANIAGHLESLLMATHEGTTTPPPETLYSYLNTAYQETERLSLLVDDLLSLARMEAHELRLDMQEIDAAAVIEEVYTALMPLAQRQRQVTLVRGASPHLPRVLADRQRLSQILLNLVRNAITSTPPGGIVSLNLEAADPQDHTFLALIVEDNGIGIPAEDLPHIFERFYRANTPNTRASRGFGLGLAIVHDLVHAMGGTIDVTSVEGQGTRFRVLLRTASSPTA